MNYLKTGGYMKIFTTVCKEVEGATKDFQKKMAATEAGKKYIHFKKKHKDGFKYLKHYSPISTLASAVSTAFMGTSSSTPEVQFAALVAEKANSGVGSLASYFMSSDSHKIPEFQTQPEPHTVTTMQYLGYATLVTIAAQSVGAVDSIFKTIADKVCPINKTIWQEAKQLKQMTREPSYLDRKTVELLQMITGDRHLWRSVQLRDRIVYAALNQTIRSAPPVCLSALWACAIGSTATNGMVAYGVYRLALASPELLKSASSYLGIAEKKGKK